MTTSAERFWLNINKSGPVPNHCPELGPCHLWMGAVGRDGYGRACLSGKCRSAHRAAFFLTYGRWPEPCCLHRCDNRPCCNPEHLFEGTNADNTSDMILKGRKHPVVGDANPMARLDSAGVKIIRMLASLGANRRQMAGWFSVSKVTVDRVCSGRGWTR